MASKGQMRDYEEDKSKLKSFLAEFHQADSRGNKDFVYARQLTAIAHREQAQLVLDLDHLEQSDPDLAQAIRNNTRR